MLLHIHPDNPNPRNLKTVVDCLKDGGVVIYPTDTVYGLGCDIFQHKAVEKVCQIRGIQPDKALFSFICYDLSHISDFTKPINTTVYKLMKKALPGPFTFILEANNEVPKILKNKRKTVGIRVPDNAICREMVKELGHPVISTSIHDDDEIVEYTTDPELIYEKYRNKVDIVIAGGYGNIEPSTVVDCSNGEITIIRQGIGIIDL